MRVAALAIVVVTFTTAAIVWASLHVIREAEKMQRDAKVLRRRLLFLGTLYVCSASWGAFQVAIGKEPPATLTGVAVAAVVAWLLIRGAAKASGNPR